MIGGPRTVAGLDVGASKTCAVTLEEGGAGEAPRVRGVGLTRTEGMSSEEVTDLAATTRSIRESLGEAEVMAGREIRSVYVGVAGSHVELETSLGAAAVAGDEVTEGDIDRAHEVGRAVAVPPDRVLLHAIPQEYRVDGRGGIQRPLGMEGVRLEADVLVVTAAAAACRDLRKAVDRAGYGVEELVLEPLAASLAVLGEAEGETGLALVEMGGSSTDVAVLRGERLVTLASLPWGGATVTRDIVKGLGVPLDEAERLKREHGVALTGQVDGDRIHVPGPSPGDSRSVSSELLAHIIEQRLDEILGLVYEELEDAGYLDDLTGGVVLAGGVASLPGVVELAQQVFNLPVRLGEPGATLSGFGDAVRTPKFATSVGLGLYGLDRERARRPAAGRMLSRMGEWVEDFF